MTGIGLDLIQGRGGKTSACPDVSQPPKLKGMRERMHVGHNELFIYFLAHHAMAIVVQGVREVAVPPAPARLCQRDLFQANSDIVIRTGTKTHGLFLCFRNAKT
jgi:hypothetical protein